MKKTLLSVAFLFATFVGTNAQQISFEASEGYSLGNINGQNGWVVTGDGQGGFISNQNISNEFASQGTYSLKLDKDPAFGGQQSSIMGGFYDFTPIADADYFVSADFYIGQPGSSTASNFGLSIADSENFIARIEFNYLSNMRSLETVGESLAWSEIDFTWEANTWYTVKIEVEGTETAYYINDVLIHEGTTVTATPGNLEHLRVTHDNYNGFAYVDNIKINDDTVSTDDFLTPSFSVYPNPATDVINISNATNTIENVTITDMNGRVVKQVALGVNEGQINISDLSQGIYILNVSSNGTSITEKIVKK